MTEAPEKKRSALNLTLPIAVVCSLLAGAAAAGLTVGTKNATLEAKIEAVEKDQAETKEKIKELSTDVQSANLEKAGMKVQLTNIEKAVDRIETKLGTK